MAKIRNNQNTAGFHKELLDNEDEIFSALRELGLGSEDAVDPLIIESAEEFEVNSDENAEEEDEFEAEE